MRNLLSILAACALLAACSDGGSSRPDAEPDPPAPPPEPEVTDLEATGVYRGRVVTPDRNVALVTATLARDGRTAVAINSDDDERPDIVLWGETSEAAGELDFAGRDSRDGSEVALTFAVEDRVLRGELRLNDLEGDIEAPLAAVSEAGDAPSGTFARQDNPGGLTELSVDGGTVSLVAPCEGSGELAAPDPAVNIHHLNVEGDCLAWEALATLEDVDGVRVLSVTGAEGLATRLYQP